MRKVVLAFLVIAIVVPALADKKIQGSTVLKDSQPAGIKGKDQKHQAYDLSFSTTDKAYTCRTDPNKSMNATDFVVGANVNYQIDGNKVKIKTTEGKQVECKVVRVEAVPAAALK
jgi:hypothetical protein